MRGDPCLRTRSVLEVGNVVGEDLVPEIFGKQCALASYTIFTEEFGEGEVSCHMIVSEIVFRTRIAKAMKNWANRYISRRACEPTNKHAFEMLRRIFGLLLGWGRLTPCSVILDKADPWHPFWCPGFHGRCCDEFLREACIVDAVFGTIQIFVCNGHLPFWQWHCCHKKESFCLLHGGRFQSFYVWWLYDAFFQTKSCVAMDVDCLPPLVLHCYTVCLHVFHHVCQSNTTWYPIQTFHPRFASVAVVLPRLPAVQRTASRCGDLWHDHSWILATFPGVAGWHGAKGGWDRDFFQGRVEEWLHSPWIYPSPRTITSLLHIDIY